MKPFLSFLLCMFAAVTACFAGPYWRVGGGYSWLFTPSLDDINTIPTVDRTRGGGSISVQALWGRIAGREDWQYGAEFSFLRSYRYEYHVPVTTEVTLHSFPLLAVAQYRLPSIGRLTPLVLGGLGATYNQLVTEIGPGSDTSVTVNATAMIGPGISIKVSDALNIDVLLRYYLMLSAGEYVRQLNLSGSVGFSW